MASIGDVKVDEASLLQKGYSTKDLLGMKVTVKSVTAAQGDSGEYIICEIEGDGVEEGRSLSTGAKNVVARLMAAKEQGLLPVTGTIVKLGSNAYDIV